MAYHIQLPNLRTSPQRSVKSCMNMALFTCVSPCWPYITEVISIKVNFSEPSKSRTSAKCLESKFAKHWFVYYKNHISLKFMVKKPQNEINNAILVCPLLENLISLIIKPQKKHHHTNPHLHPQKKSLRVSVSFPASHDNHLRKKHGGVGCPLWMVTICTTGWGCFQNCSKSRKNPGLLSIIVVG